MPRKNGDSLHQAVVAPHNENEDGDAFLTTHFDPLLLASASAATAQSDSEKRLRKERKRLRKEQKHNASATRDSNTSTDAEDTASSHGKRKKKKLVDALQVADIPVLGYSELLAPASTAAGPLQPSFASVSRSHGAGDSNIPIDPALTDIHQPVPGPAGIRPSDEAIAAAAVAALAAQSKPDTILATATQEQLIATLRALNPNLKIEDATLAAAGRSIKASSSTKLADSSRGSSKVIDAASAPPAETSSINKTLMSSLCGMSHAEVLTSKWLNTTQLNELVETQGLDMKKGQFSQTEKNGVDAAIEAYSDQHGLDKAALQSIIFAKGKAQRGQHSDFFPSLARAVEKRPLVAVYNFVKRAYNPLSKQGPWTGEEDAALLEATVKYGHSAWEKIGDEVGRTKSDCRDRWRNHLSVMDTKRSGKWSADEEQRLREVVKSVTTDQGKSADTDVFWSVVSQKMGGERSRAQCRIKWLDSMNVKDKRGGEMRAWMHRDTLILAQRLLDLGMQDDTGFNWHTVEDDDWGGWSAHLLQRRWRKVKTAVQSKKSAHNLTVPEILQKVVNEMNDRPDEELDQPLRAPAIRNKPDLAQYPDGLDANSSGMITNDANQSNNLNLASPLEVADGISSTPRGSGAMN